MTARAGAVFWLLVSLAAVAPLAAAPPDPALLAGLAARSIGPAGMSGRVAAIDVVRSNPDLIWVGAATGGVWKSVNGGLTWRPVFDDQPVAAIGAVAVNQRNPSIVWVGTGEGNPRNSVSVGNGVYRSLDGGATWAHLGLDESERIHRIVLHPDDPNVAWVAAMGRAWGENEQRGVFKTTDGGETWRKVLYVDERTGAADLVIDPSNPLRLFAAMWDYRRWPWFFRSGGPGSGLFTSGDGGETWKRVTPEDGFPEGDLGRIGVAIAPSDPDVVYALVEAKKNALYLSRDGGKSWSVAGSHKEMGNRPFYFADIHVDPDWPGRVYSLWSVVSVSDDWGKTFRQLVRYNDVHPDHHALWIDPGGGRRMVLGNDGGIALSRDRGATWRFAPNLPLAQYYHVAVDMETPYHVYGGLQDNGSWRGPAEIWENGGIRNHHWEEVGFGDGFDTRPVPGEAWTGYAMSQEGYLLRWNLRTGERKDIRPPAPDDTELRFNWNAALAQDPFDANTIYFGSQFVHRSRDRGETWEILSGDLTTNNPEWQEQKESGGLTPDVTGAENFTTIISIAPSPVERGVLWVGTDDGRIHVTRDGGETWVSVEGAVRGVPANTWVPHIEPSKYDAGAAWVVFDNHRRSDWTPYVARTTDFGKHWSMLDLSGVRGYALVAEQDPVDRDLWFLGTEFGLWISVDGGDAWFRFDHGLPTVAVRDLVVHPRDHDLVIATHGRALYVIDDICPLRSLDAASLAEPLRLFEIPDVRQHRVKQTGASRFPGSGEFRGTNRPYGALITYSVNVEGLPHPDDDVERELRARRRAAGRDESPEDERDADEKTGDKDKPKVRVRIRDGDGDIVRTFESPATLGVNRAVWDLRADPFRSPRDEDEEDDSRRRGPEVLPGVYSVTVSYGDHEAEGNVRVLADPRFDVARADAEAKWAAIQRAGAAQERFTDAVLRIRRTRDDVKIVLDKLRQAARDAVRPGEEPDDLVDPELKQAAEALQKSLDEAEHDLWSPPETKGIVARDHALALISYTLRSLGSSWDAPTPAQLDYLGRAERRLDEALDRHRPLFDTEVPEFRRRVREAGVALLSDTPSPDPDHADSRGDDSQ